jgi:hypothetical protein
VGLGRTEIALDAIQVGFVEREKLRITRELSANAQFSQPDAVGGRLLPNSPSVLKQYSYKIVNIRVEEGETA